MRCPHGTGETFVCGRAGDAASVAATRRCSMRLFRFRHSPYARKVQMVLELLGTPHEVVEVSYVDRTEMARLTGGTIMVPVLVDDAGVVTVESRDICAKLLAGPGGARLVPAPFEGPIWAYADFIDG